MQMAFKQNFLRQAGTKSCAGGIPYQWLKTLCGKCKCYLAFVILIPASGVYQRP
jgi:hypothetical protein